MKVQKSTVILWVLILQGMVIVSGCGPVTVETPTPETVVLQETQTAIALARLEVELKQTQTALAATQTAMALIATPAATPTQAELTATPTPTATPEPTDTPTVGPTDTSAPVDTPTATPIPTDTSTPTDTPTPMLALRVIPPDPAICGPCPPGVPPGDCCLAITIEWEENIQLDDGRIYLLASVGGGQWWIAGTGFLPTQPTRQGYITDGSFSSPGSFVTLFACQTTETYLPGQSFVGRPTSCTLSSPDVLMQTQ